jgi:hypothetical protein
MLRAQGTIQQIFDRGTAMPARLRGEPGQNALVAWIVGMQTKAKGVHDA